jgi:peroxiredoxin
LLVTFAVLSLTACDRGSKPELIGKPAPDFTLADADRTVSLHDFKGKVVVLNFWASWCPPCIEETPALVQMQQDLGDNVKVLAVSIDEDPDAYKRFLDRFHANFISVRDPSAHVKNIYGTIKIPESYIIDQNGIVRRKFISSVAWTKPEIEKYLREMADHKT